MTKQSRPNIERLFQEAGDYSSVGAITLINNVFRKIREHDTSLATEEQLLVLMREGYRNHMELLLDSAKSNLEKSPLEEIQREEIQKKLDEARTHALELNGRDAIYFLLNAPPLYTRLKELRASA